MHTGVVLGGEYSKCLGVQGGEKGADEAALNGKGVDAGSLL